MKQVTKKQKTLNSLNKINSFERLDADSCKKIMGGCDPTPAEKSALIASLSTILVNSTTDTITPANWALFNGAVEMLAGTSVGYYMLSQIVSYANTNGRHVTISGKVAGALNLYRSSPSGGVIDLGYLFMQYNIYNPSWDNNQEAILFGTIAHELFHAFDYLKNGFNIPYNRSVRKELDAYLFEAMACGEVDQNTDWGTLNNLQTPIGMSYTYWDNCTFTHGVTRDEDYFAYSNIFYDVFHNNNFSLENYNNLIDKFFVGSKEGSGYPSTLSKTEITATTFENSAIFEFFNKYLEPACGTTDPNPIPLGFESNMIPVLDPYRNVGSNHDGSGYNFNGDPNFSTWLNSYMNSGYEFYTGYIETTTTTINTGFFPTLYGNGWLFKPQGDISIYSTTTTKTTEYIEPTMSEWFNAYNQNWFIGGFGQGGYLNSLS